jgi:hypothetical protein
VVEKLKTFIQRYSKAVGCYNHPYKTSNKGYSIKKCNLSPTQRRLGNKPNIFGWVVETSAGQFEVHLHDSWADVWVKAHAKGTTKRGVWGTAVEHIYPVDPGSRGADYQDAVTAGKKCLAKLPPCP